MLGWPTAATRLTRPSCVLTWARSVVFTNLACKSRGSGSSPVVRCWPAGSSGPASSPGGVAVADARLRRATAKPVSIGARCRNGRGRKPCGRAPRWLRSQPRPRGAMRFRGLLKGSNPEPLDGWLSEAASSGIHGMRRFAATLRQDLVAVRNAISEPWSNGQTEGQINRLKTLKRSMYGRAGVELLRARMLPYASCTDHTVLSQTQAIWLYLRFALSFRDVEICSRSAGSRSPTRPFDAGSITSGPRSLPVCESAARSLASRGI